MKNKQVFTFDEGILGDLDATAIAEKIKAKEFTAKEVLECVQQRAEKADVHLNSIVASNYNPEEIPTEGVFAGVPMFIKDLVNAKDFPTLLGSNSVPDNIWKKDDKIISQYRMLGCPIIGKSATSEFGLLPSCETLQNGFTRNPHHLDYSPGGSSGGAGSLVASGIVPIAHTMDGGGSTRIPASCCGLVGLKPSRGADIESPTKGLPIDLVNHGVVSRTVRDTANYFHEVEKFVASKTTSPKHIQSPSKRRLRIGMFTESPMGIDSHQEVSRVILETGKICESLGHQVEYIKNPYDDRVLLDFITYYSMLAKGIMIGGKFTYNKGFKKRNVEPFTKELSRYFFRLLHLSWGSTRRLKKGLVNDYNAQFEKYDLVLSPTLASPVQKSGYFGTDVPVVAMIMRLNSFANFTVIQNATGAPAISLPMGFCKNGLPIGAMFGAKLGDDHTLLEMAFELEEAGVFKLMN